MAGSFGFEHDKYEISAAIGELDLLPAVRAANPQWLIIADGFSCREQIAQGTDRQALHLAEVLQMALDGASPEPEPYPERPLTNRRQQQVEASMKGAGLAVAGLAAAGALYWAISRRD